MNIDDLRSVKANIYSQVRWGTSLPNYVFAIHGYRYAYFFESPVAGRLDLLSEIGEFLTRSYASPGYISIGHDSGTGRYDSGFIESTTLKVDPDLINERLGPFFLFLRSNPYTGVTCGADSKQNWLLYDDPSDGAGVLVSKKSLARSERPFRNLLPADELIACSGPNGLDWDPDFVDQLVASYA